MDISATEPESHVVLDNFLGHGERSDLWRHFQGSTFHSVHLGGWKRAFGFNNGEVVRGENLAIERRDALSLAETKSPSDCLKKLVERVLSDGRCSAFLASCGDWSAINVNTYIYAAGSGLAWHSDPEWAASFIYYAHPSWSPNWGGELMIAKRGPVTGASRGEFSIQSEPGHFLGFYSKYTAVDMYESSGGEFIFPVPNRLVLIRRGTPHCVKRVEAAAGEAFRASVAGFLCGVPGETPGPNSGV